MRDATSGCARQDGYIANRKSTGYRSAAVTTRGRIQLRKLGEDGAPARIRIEPIARMHRLTGSSPDQSAKAPRAQNSVRTRGDPSVIRQDKVCRQSAQHLLCSFKDRTLSVCQK